MAVAPTKQIIRHKIDFCNGKEKLKSDDWWVLNGSNASKCTYCNWCVENGCIDKTTVTQSSGEVMTCYCDCRKQHNNNPIALKCTTCMIKMGFTSTFYLDDIFLKDESAVTHKGGKCISCGLKHDFMNYCDVCSYVSKHCVYCGESLKSGDDYVKDLAELIERIKKRYAECTPQQNPTIPLLRENIHKYFSKMLELVKEKYSGKSVEEVKVILAENSKTNLGWLMTPQTIQKIFFEGMF